MKTKKTSIDWKFVVLMISLISVIALLLFIAHVMNTYEIWHDGELAASGMATILALWPIVLVGSGLGVAFAWMILSFVYMTATDADNAEKIKTLEQLLEISQEKRNNAEERAEIRAQQKLSQLLSDARSTLHNAQDEEEKHNRARLQYEASSKKLELKRKAYELELERNQEATQTAIACVREDAALRIKQAEALAADAEKRRIAAFGYNERLKTKIKKLENGEL